MQAEWALVTDDGKDVSKKLKDFLFDAEGNLLIHSLYLISATDASLSCVLSSKNWKPQRIVQDPTKRAFETAGYVGLHNIRSFLPENSTFTGEAMNRENLYGFRQCGWKKEDFADTLASFTKGHLLPERRAVFDDSLGVKDPYVSDRAKASWWLRGCCTCSPIPHACRRTSSRAALRAAATARTFGTRRSPWIRTCRVRAGTSSWRPPRR